jgi:AraC-like DNA-binding protein
MQESSQVWSNPSTFIDAFSDVLGQTPDRYQADLK